MLQDHRRKGLDSHKSEKYDGPEKRTTNPVGAGNTPMTDDPTSVGDERCSSHVQRLDRKNVVKSFRIATAVKDVEGKTCINGIQTPSGGFVVESRGKHSEKHSVPHSSGKSTSH